MSHIIYSIAMLIINAICICFVRGEIGSVVHVKLWTFDGAEGIQTKSNKCKKGGGGPSFGYFVTTK